MDLRLLQPGSNPTEVGYYTTLLYQAEKTVELNHAGILVTTLQINTGTNWVLEFVITVYVLIYRTAKNNYFGNCPGIIGTDFYRACEVSGIIRTSK